MKLQFKEQAFQLEAVDSVADLFEGQRELNEIIKNNECYNLKQLAVNGDDLMEHGVPEGKDIKIILDALLSDVIEEKLENNKKTLLKEVDKIVTMYYVNC